MTQVSAERGSDPTHEPHPPSPGLDAVSAVAFDCYGTLIDFGEHHFVDLMGVVALRNELGIEGKELWDRWLAISKELWRERGRDPERPTAGTEPRFGTYVEIWTEQFERAFAAAERQGDAEAAYALMVEHLQQAAPYPEVHDVIAALRPRYRICVLSNADDDWLRPCLERAGLSFELVVSSESARSYKPRTKIFHDTVQALGLRPENVLYVGDSPLADVLGARHAGLPVAWVNRYGAKLGDGMPAPDIEITDLLGLLPVLAGGPGR
ncbi:MAG: HAD family hydrolase [Dehalococcoidia bacterium]